MDWNHFFFSDVGKKIKKIIRICFYVVAVLTLIAGAVLELVAFVKSFIEGEAFYLLLMILVPIGVVVAIGTLWLSTLLTYGFAEIVDTAIVNRQEQTEPARTKMLSAIAEQKEEENKAFWVCECGMKNTEHTASCRGCGKSCTGAAVRGDGGTYKRCDCGAMVKQGAKCPLCGEMVY